MCSSVQMQTNTDRERHTHTHAHTVSWASCAPLPSEILVSSFTATLVQLSPSITLLYPSVRAVCTSRWCLWREHTGGWGGWDWEDWYHWLDFLYEPGFLSQNSNASFSLQLSPVLYLIIWFDFSRAGSNTAMIDFCQDLHEELASPWPECAQQVLPGRQCLSWIDQLLQQLRVGFLNLWLWRLLLVLWRQTAAAVALNEVIHCCFVGAGCLCWGCWGCHHNWTGKIQNLRDGLIRKVDSWS